jgi:hypothetical protein
MKKEDEKTDKLDNLPKEKIFKDFSNKIKNQEAKYNHGFLVLL